MRKNRFGLSVALSTPFSGIDPRLLDAVEQGPLGEAEVRKLGRSRR